MAVPHFFTQPDLKKRKISSSARQTKYLVDHHNFPPGRMLSPQIRGWTEDELTEWLASRPVKSPCNIPESKRPRGRPRREAAPAPATATP
jgi:predicted DNA-binding transcriptional regulator AlpA